MTATRALHPDYLRAFHDAAAETLTARQAAVIAAAAKARAGRVTVDSDAGAPWGDVGSSVLGAPVKSDTPSRTPVRAIEEPKEETTMTKSAVALTPIERAESWRAAYRHLIEREQATGLSEHAAVQRVLTRAHGMDVFKRLQAAAGDAGIPKPGAQPSTWRPMPSGAELQLYRAADELRRSEPALTPAQALDRAMTQNPALVLAARREVEPVAVDTTKSDAHAELTRLADGIRRADPALTREQALARAMRADQRLTMRARR